MKSSLRVLGTNVPLQVVALLIFIGGVFSLFIFCEQWHVNVREPMLEGAPLGYNMQKGVPQTWNETYKSSGKYGPSSWYQHLDANMSGPVSPTQNNLYMFGDNEEHPKCCPAAYSTSQGCVCLSAEQAKFINSRGGNRSREDTTIVRPRTVTHSQCKVLIKINASIQFTNAVHPTFTLHQFRSLLIWLSLQEGWYGF